MRSFVGQVLNVEMEETAATAKIFKNLQFVSKNLKTRLRFPRFPPFPRYI